MMTTIKKPTLASFSGLVRGRGEKRLVSTISAAPSFLGNLHKPGWERGYGTASCDLQMESEGQFSWQPNLSQT